MATWAGLGLPVRMAAWAWKLGKSIISRQGAAAAFVFHGADTVFFVFYKYRRIYMKAIAGSVGYASAYLAYPVAPPLTSGCWQSML